MPFTIFADATAADMNTFSVAMAVIAALGAFGASFLAYLSGRDKLRFDAEVVSLRAQVKALTDEVATCHDEKNEMRAELAELRKLVMGRSGPLTSLPPSP